uniref:Ubiquitinyl hydrolase 1 n=1 Tax=Rhabditophanes sp. KR3021 TaxID=114890 RepID=A0AC35U6F1_9BILA
MGPPTPNTPSNSGFKFYHERQKKQLCLLHALNNLFQAPRFSKNDLDRLCEQMDKSAWWNAHRSFIGLGDYDANVLMAAVDKFGYTCTWFDRRSDPKIIQHEKIFGYIFNVPSESFFPFIKKRHWLSVIRFNGNQFVNLDSKLSYPQRVNNFNQFAEDLLTNGNTLILIHKREDVCI